MKLRRIGSTSIEVTEVGLGGAALGGLYRAVDRDAAEQTLAAAWDSGVRYFD